MMSSLIALLKIAESKELVPIFFPTSRSVETTRNYLQCTRVTGKTFDPDEGVVNIRLVKELNHIQTPETLSDTRTKCCALNSYANGKQVSSREICCSVCNVYLCVPK